MLVKRDSQEILCHKSYNMVMAWLVFLIIFNFHLMKGTNGFVCYNMYDKMSPTIGHFAIVEPRNSRYYLDAVVRFHCPKHYHFDNIYFRRKKFIWSKCHETGWSVRHWPICRGIYENVTCPNQYLHANHYNMSWLNETPNRKHALYGRSRARYPHMTTLKFQCPNKMNFLGAMGLVVMESYCQKNGKWSKEWPMCKGHTCSPYRLIDGITGDENRLFVPGTTVDIRCWPDFYLIGSNRSTCLGDLSWSGFRECVTYDEFKSRCIRTGDIFLLDSNGKPRCRRVAENYDELRKQEEEKAQRITIGSAVPLSMLFVIFVTVTALYVRRLRARNGMLALVIRYQNQDEALEMFLPSYEDAEKSKPMTPPPTFEESQNTFLPGNLRPSTRPPRSPPPYEETLTS